MAKKKTERKRAFLILSLIIIVVVAIFLIARPLWSGNDLARIRKKCRSLDAEDYTFDCSKYTEINGDYVLTCEWTNEYDCTQTWIFEKEGIKEDDVGFMGYDSPTVLCSGRTLEETYQFCYEDYIPDKLKGRVLVIEPVKD